MDRWETSATEYSRFIHFAPEHPLSFYAHYRLGLAENHLGRSDEAARMLRAAVRQAPTRDLQQRIRYRLGLAFLSAQQPEQAKLELLQLIVGQPDSVLATYGAIVAALAFAYQEQWTQTAELLKLAQALQPDNTLFGSFMAEADIIIDQIVQGSAKKSPRTAKLLSTVLPGSGQAYSGNVLSGANSLAINAGTTYLVYRSVVMGSIFSAGLLASSLWWRYYQGNRLHAAEAAIRVNQRLREDLLERFYGTVEQSSRYLPQRVTAVTLQEAEHNVKR